jgi:hypothetical protein
MAATKKSKNKKKLTGKKAAKTTSSKEPPIIAELRQQVAESLEREKTAVKDRENRDQIFRLSVTNASRSRLRK